MPASPSPTSAGPSPTASAYWIPMTWLSLMLDQQLFGSGPFGFHLTNLLLHLANALLLYWFLRAATGSVWRSALAAAALRGSTRSVSNPSRGSPSAGRALHPLRPARPDRLRPFRTPRRPGWCRALGHVRPGHAPPGPEPLGQADVGHVPLHAPVAGRLASAAHRSRRPARDQVPTSTSRPAAAGEAAAADRGWPALLRHLSDTISYRRRAHRRYVQPLRARQQRGHLLRPLPGQNVLVRQPGGALPLRAPLARPRGHRRATLLLAISVRRAVAPAPSAVPGRRLVLVPGHAGAGDRHRAVRRSIHWPTASPTSRRSAWRSWRHTPSPTHGSPTQRAGCSPAPRPSRRCWSWAVSASSRSAIGRTASRLYRHAVNVTRDNFVAHDLLGTVLAAGADPPQPCRHGPD